MMGSFPNNGVISPKVASNIVASFGNLALNANNNTSDNAGSSPNTNIVSPNIDYVFRNCSYCFNRLYIIKNHSNCIESRPSKI